MLRIQPIITMGFSLLIELIQKAAKDMAAFNAQYPQLDVKYTNLFHDRFLILDGKTVYHIGASLKDAGKKCFGVTLMKDAGPDLMKTQFTLIHSFIT